MRALGRSEFQYEFTGVGVVDFYQHIVVVGGKAREQLAFDFVVVERGVAKDREIVAFEDLQPATRGAAQKYAEIQVSLEIIGIDIEIDLQVSVKTVLVQVVE